MRPPEPKISRLQIWALRLNRRQVRALVLGLCGCLLFLVWQPWDFVYRNQLGATRSVWAGFSVGTPTPPQVNIARGCQARQSQFGAGVNRFFSARLPGENAQAA